jgi:mannonate dehydratase
MLAQTWRWFGPNDRISLEDIQQTGASSIVTALHQIPVGEVWPAGEIATRKTMIESAGFSWPVVESVPVHEDIKKQSGNFKGFIENYKQTLRNLAAHQIKTVCYNFMPVLDWSRTNLSYPLSDRSEVTRFDYIVFIAFDMYILKREHAEDSYPPPAVEKAHAYYQSLSNQQKDSLQKTILLGLPGSGETFSPAQLKAMLKEYEQIGSKQLKENLFYFLNEVVPVAEENGIMLAIHPDDPPWSLMGLPRIVGNEEDLSDIVQAYDSKHNGIAFCTGSLGAGYFNNVGEMAEKFAYRINFAHLRNVWRDEGLNFHEAYLFEGDIDIVRVMRALVQEEQRRVEAGRADWQIPMRPDHGNQTLGDIGKDNYPGYSLYGRMKNLAEIRGLEIGLRHTT